ncbi:MAG: hypothetical protein LIO69_02195 [Oscillospiraceae bacterium]|nr:hypothetical protein [Oscillospiraceae bacterium]
MTENIRFPLPLSAHIIFVVVSVALLILCYIYRRHNYHILLIIGIASTLLVYATDTKPTFYILGLEEFILLILAVIDMVRASRAEALEEKASQSKPPQHYADSAPQNEDTDDSTTE